MESLKKTIVSLLILALFIYGLGTSAFFPTLKILRDMNWDFSIWPRLGFKKMVCLLWLIPIGLGFFGWARILKSTLLRGMGDSETQLLTVALNVCFFSFTVFGLAINRILYEPLVLVFFVPLMGFGWKSLSGFKVSFKWPGFGLLLWFIAGVSLLVWGFEYMSPPIIWDAILDHFRYAREVARLHQIPFHWTNHTGEMPKFVETLLAGFWSLGGENLSKLSSALAAFLMALLISFFTQEWKGRKDLGLLIWGTCPLFLALFAWGYVEGFLAFYETLALFCLWRAFQNPKVEVWGYLWAFFLGVSFSIKYTAVLAIGACGALWVFEWLFYKSRVRFNWRYLVFFLLPVLPWLLKNLLANSNPVYPLATFLFGGPPGFNSGMESDLWEDTGLPGGFSFVGILKLLRDVFFTANNGVGAAWTPLVFMSLPWAWKIFKSKVGLFLTFFSIVFFTEWIFFCTSLRHASGGAAVLVLLAALVWFEALKEKSKWPKLAFTIGAVISLWLCLSAQWTVTAPYAAALGLDDPSMRLKRNYCFNLDTFAAYKGIEDQSNPRDKVLAFGVYQTYPLQRTAYVDFFWKKPVFLKWASSCRTAEQLAARLHQEGVSYFLYQRNEAVAMSFREKNFTLEGMSTAEYVKFWRFYMKPVCEFENTWVYKVSDKPFPKAMVLGQLPGLQEKWLGALRKAEYNHKDKERGQIIDQALLQYPFVGVFWGEKAFFEGNHGQYKQAVLADSKSMASGFINLDVLNEMIEGLNKEQQPNESERWMNQKNETQVKLDKTVDESLIYYRDLE